MLLPLFFSASIIKQSNNDSHNHEECERNLSNVNPIFTFLVQTSSWIRYLLVSMWKSNRHDNLKMSKLIS